MGLAQARPNKFSNEIQKSNLKSDQSEIRNLREIQWIWKSRMQWQMANAPSPFGG